MAEFEIDTNRNGEYIWRFQAGGNNEIVAVGESYRDKRNCQHAIELLKRDAASAGVNDKT